MLLRMTAEGIGCHAGDPRCAGGAWRWPHGHLVRIHQSQDHSRARILACPGALC
jgi:hypothetical protein